MRLHLPPSLRSALLASLVSFSGIYSYSHAATSADFWQIPDFGGPDFTWTGDGEGDAVGTADNWEGDAAPSRVDNKGPHLIFNGVEVTVTGNPPNTSDGGGISVTGNGSVSAGLGQWGGNVYVEKGSTLTTSFSNQIKNTEAEGHANIYVDGALNMTTPGGNLNFDHGSGAGNHYWHIGLDGMVNLSNTTTITKNSKTWNVEVVVASAMEELSVTNREMVDDALITRYFMSTGADLGASLDSLRIWKQTGDDAYEALTRVDSAGQLGAGNFLLVSNGSGMSVQYKGEGYDAETLVWNSNGTWSNTGTGWYKQGDGTKTDTSFLNGDAVIFTAAEGSKTVNFSGGINVSSMTFETDYTLLPGEGATLFAQETVLSNGSSLTLGDGDHRFSGFESLVTGGENSSLTVYMKTEASSAGSVNLLEGSALQNLYVYGALRLGASSQSGSWMLGGANLHMMAGSTMVFDSDAGTSIGAGQTVIAEGSLNV
ncbi:hypothetical protein, partial [uncultured Akkermansia sp.]